MPKSALEMQGSEGFDVFISYSTRNKHTADAMKQYLQAKGIRCWKASDDIIPGESWARAIPNAIKMSRIMVIIWTKYSMNSGQVVNELTLAARSHKLIIPFRTESIEPENEFEYYLAKTHWLDAFSGSLDDHFESLYQRIAVNLSQEASADRASSPDADASETISFKPLQSSESDFNRDQGVAIDPTQLGEKPAFWDDSDRSDQVSDRCGQRPDGYPDALVEQCASTLATEHAEGIRVAVTSSSTNNQYSGDDHFDSFSHTELGRLRDSKKRSDLPFSAWCKKCSIANLTSEYFQAAGAYDIKTYTALELFNPVDLVLGKAGKKKAYLTRVLPPGDDGFLVRFLQKQCKDIGDDLGLPIAYFNAGAWGAGILFLSRGVVFRVLNSTPATAYRYSKDERLNWEVVSTYTSASSWKGHIEIAVSGLEYKGSQRTERTFGPWDAAPSERNELISFFGAMKLVVDDLQENFIVE